jgi:hypothetical protein
MRRISDRNSLKSWTRLPNSMSRTPSSTGKLWLWMKRDAHLFNCFTPMTSVKSGPPYSLMHSISCKKRQGSKKLSLHDRKAILQKLINKPPGVIRYSAALGDDDALPLLQEARNLDWRDSSVKGRILSMRLGSEVALGSDSNCLWNRNL